MKSVIYQAVWYNKDELFFIGDYAHPTKNNNHK